MIKSETKKKSKVLLLYLGVLSTASLLILVYINWQVAKNTKKGLENFTEKIESAGKSTAKSTEELKETFEKIEQSLTRLEKPLSGASGELESIKKGLGNVDLAGLKEELAKITKGIEEKITGFSEGIKNLESGLKNGLLSVSNISANLGGLKTELEELKKMGEKFAEKIGTSTLTDLSENLTKQIKEFLEKIICTHCDQPRKNFENLFSFSLRKNYQAKLEEKKWKEMIKKKLKITIAVKYEEGEILSIKNENNPSKINSMFREKKIKSIIIKNKEDLKEIQDLKKKGAKEEYPITLYKWTSYIKFSSIDFTKSGNCNECGREIELENYQNYNNLEKILDLWKEN